MTTPFEKRKQQRRHLIYYLKILNSDENILIGHVIDITTEGLMMLSEQRIEHGEVLNVTLEMPQDLKIEPLHLTMQCMWSRPDVNPEYQASGYLFVDHSDTARKTIQRLISSIGFSGG
jgi:hypothetical protein